MGFAIASDGLRATLRRTVDQLGAPFVGMKFERCKMDEVFCLCRISKHLFVGVDVGLWIFVLLGSSCWRTSVQLKHYCNVKTCSRWNTAPEVHRLHAGYTWNVGLARWYFFFVFGLEGFCVGFLTAIWLSYHVVHSKPESAGHLPKQTHSMTGSLRSARMKRLSLRRSLFYKLMEPFWQKYRGISQLGNNHPKNWQSQLFINSKFAVKIYFSDRTGFNDGLQAMTTLFIKLQDSTREALVAAVSNFVQRGGEENSWSCQTMYGLAVLFLLQNYAKNETS